MKLPQKVYVCEQCVSNGLDGPWSEVIWVCGDEASALEWCSEFDNTEDEWREYTEFTIDKQDYQD